MLSKSLFYGLPHIPRWKIVRLMDYESKYQLGKCSKRTYNIIDSIIFSLDKIIFRSRPRSIEIEIANNFGGLPIYCIFSKRDNENCERSIDGCKSIVRGDFVTTALMELKKIFCYKKSRTRGLNIEETFENNTTKTLISRITSVLSSLGHQLSVRSLQLFSSGNDDFSLGFLPFLKPEILKTILIFSGPRTELHILKDIVKLEQWKKVQSVYICHDQLDVPVESIKHLSYYHNERQKTSMEIKTIIENYFDSEFFVRARLKCQENPFNSDFDLPFHFNPSTHIYRFQKGETAFSAKTTPDGFVFVRKHKNINHLLTPHYVISKSGLLLRRKCYAIWKKLPPGCETYASRYLSCIRECEKLYKENIELKVAACLFVACHHLNSTNSIIDISEVFGVSVEEIVRFAILVVTWNNDCVARTITEICRLLGLSESFREAALGIARKAIVKKMFLTRIPMNIAAATIYMTTKVTSEKRTIIEIGEKTKTGVASNLELFEIMWAEKAELLPE
ncbi:hypothetical protein GCK72_000747 [Caenorhabditis remanei]|uniref:Uncharacterized protein n=1 Tax=Caenorhabditis remanei TaxID=31234 RepID=A0A6A5HQP3_CAERE|nr:hypothetical protein GCK72_000747 [Caenorhabditis remanei]KAF1768934.1 hypothetical protein GCK72_000747 [Caenorhabditis remanei]